MYYVLIMVGRKRDRALERVSETERQREGARERGRRQRRIEQKGMVEEGRKIKKDLRSLCLSLTFSLLFYQGAILVVIRAVIRRDATLQFILTALAVIFMGKRRASVEGEDRRERERKKPEGRGRKGE